MRVTLVFDQSLVKISRAWVHVGPCGGACMWGEGVYSLSSPVGDVVAMSVPWSWACVTPMLDQMVALNSRRSVHVEPQARACSWRGCVYSLSTLEIDVRGLSSSVIAIVDTPGPSLVGAITSQLLEVGRCHSVRMSARPISEALSRLVRICGLAATAAGHESGYLGRWLGS